MIVDLLPNFLHIIETFRMRDFINTHLIPSISYLHASSVLNNSLKPVIDNLTLKIPCSV